MSPITDARGVLPFPVEYRALDAEATPFVFDSWLRSFHDGSPEMRSVPRHRYKRAQTAVIAKCIAEGAVVLALDPTNRDESGRRVVYGWACCADDDRVGILHYAYVIVTRRRIGLGRELVRMAGHACGRIPEQYSHRTVTGAMFAGKLRDAEDRRLSFDPFAVVRMVMQCA